MKRGLSAALALAALAGCAASTRPLPATTATATFRASDADFPNPERGFYRPLSTDLAALDPNEVRAAFAQGHRLLYARIDLSPYRTSTLPDDFLDRLDAAFAGARRAGVKLIVRATYNYPRGETNYRDAQDAPLPRVLEHIDQLGVVWRRNADMIAFVQAGFVGAWGEWHASSNDLTAPADRNRIKDALLEAVPPQRFVQFRYPPYIQDWIPTLLTPEAASSGRLRIGFHNDCFLASDTDVGTFSEDPQARQAQQAFLDRLGDLTPFGGETCNPADDPDPRPRTGCDAILAEGARYNLTYLNTSYYRRLFHDRWTADGCMDEVRRRLGYRFFLASASHTARAARGSILDIAIRARNDGWARLYNPRPVVMLFQHQHSGSIRKIIAEGADPRNWLPGAEIDETLRIPLPADLSTGVYTLLIALPDADQRLADDPRYAIRPANADDARSGQRWDETLGAFSLGTTLTVE